MVSGSTVLLGPLLLSPLCFWSVQDWQQLEDVLFCDGLQGPIADVVNVLTLRNLVLTPPVVHHPSPGVDSELITGHTQRASLMASGSPSGSAEPLHLLCSG